MFFLDTLDPELVRIPLVEIFQTIEGEGTAAGYPTVFVRLFGCPLRCVWCDTPYSYAPAKAEEVLPVRGVCDRIRGFRARRVCLTGGEPLLYRERSALLLREIAEVPTLVDVHVETSGAIPLQPFLDSVTSEKVRYIMDYKLPDSGECDKMHLPNLEVLRAQDELKFVVASERDMELAFHVLEVYRPDATVLFSPVWGRMDPRKMVEAMLERGPANARLSLQLHKFIWDPEQRGV